MTAAYRQQVGPLQDAETRASTPASWVRPDLGGAGGLLVLGNRF